MARYTNRETATQYWRALWKHYRAMLTGVTALIIATIGAAVSSPVWLVVLAISATGFVGAQYLAWRDLRAERDSARVELADAEAAAPPAPVVVTQLPDLDRGASVLFRVRVQNVGERKAFYRARVAELHGLDPTGVEAPFELAWRHGNDRWAIEISPDDDEVWLDVGELLKFPAEKLRSVERDRWQPVVVFSILIREGEPAQEMGSAIINVATADDLRTCSATARLTIRHVSSGLVVANKSVSYSYVEDGGRFMPRVHVSDA